MFWEDFYLFNQISGINIADIRWELQLFVTNFTIAFISVATLRSVIFSDLEPKLLLRET